MSANASAVSIGIFGSDDNDPRLRHGCGLWPAGYASAITQAGGTPILLEPAESPWDDVLEELSGVLLIGSDDAELVGSNEAIALCEWCRRHHVPLLAIDHGMHVLNQASGGTIHQDLPRELPEALQHRHRPEKGVRHAINITQGTRLAEIYGEGEVIVNSEHRRAVQRVGRGFRVSATALDGVVEAIEPESPAWFALGAQWHPASETASGLDIQLFRGLIDACLQRTARPARVCAA